MSEVIQVRLEVKSEQRRVEDGSIILLWLRYEDITSIPIKFSSRQPSILQASSTAAEASRRAAEGSEPC